MSKIEIDYSNTIIYKITCKDTTINDVYVGHTTNFVQRKHTHKNSCINEKTCNYKCKLYDTIRKNGGWDNWQMEIIGFYNCANHYEAREKEQEFFISLNATLNSIEPLSKSKVTNVINKYYCETCDLKFETLKFLEIHNVDDHNKINNVTKNTENKYFCKCCYYTTSKKSNITNHYSSIKHNAMVDKLNNNILNSKQNLKFTCQNCCKEYKDYSGLWRHKKKCVIIEKINEEIKTNDKDLIVMLIKENYLLKSMMTNITEKSIASQNTTTINKEENI